MDFHFSACRNWKSILGTCEVQLSKILNFFDLENFQVNYQEFLIIEVFEFGLQKFWAWENLEAAFRIIWLWKNFYTCFQEFPNLETISVRQFCKKISEIRANEIFPSPEVRKTDSEFSHYHQFYSTSGKELNLIFENRSHEVL